MHKFTFFRQSIFPCNTSLDIMKTQQMTEQQQMNIDECFSTMAVMLRQDKIGYKLPDYLRNLPRFTESGLPVDAIARSAIVDWCFLIMETCDYRAETAMIAVSCLDRFVATSDGRSILLDRVQYQLASLAAVYLAIKVHEQQALTPSIIARLSHGLHTEASIEAMERRMLSAISWRVNPPTPLDFSRKFLEIIPEQILDDDDREEVIDLVQSQAKLSMKSYDVCLMGASKTAFAALLNAFQRVKGNKITSSMALMIDQMIDTKSHSFINLQNQLSDAIGYHSTMELPKAKEPISPCQTSHSSSCNSNDKTRSRSLSPKSVQIS